MSVQLVHRVAGDPLAVQPASPYNGTSVQRIDKGYQNLAYFDVRMTFTVTHSGYTVPPNKLVESVENFLASVVVGATGKGGASAIGTVKACNAAYFFQMTRFMEGTLPIRIDAGTNNSAYQCETNFRIYFALPPRGRNLGTLTPQELWFTHLFDARFVSNFTTSYTFRDQTAMFTGTGANSGTTTISNVLITTQVCEVIGFPSHMKTGTGIRPIIRAYVKESQSLLDVTTTQVDKVYKDLQAGNKIRRVTFKGTVGSNSFSDPSDAPFNYTGTGRAEGQHTRLRENNSYNFMDVNYFQQRNLNKKVYNLENFPTGYMVWEPASGRDTRGVERLDVMVDTNFTNGSTNEIEATVQEIVG